MYRYPLSLFRRSALRSRAHPRPTFSPYLAPSWFFASTVFFRRGEKMRAARRLVEGTDDVVSDVPPPGTLGGGDARETMVRGRAVECELRHPRGVHISRGCRCWIYRGWASGRIGWKYYYIREALASLNARVQPTAPDSCGLSPLCHPRTLRAFPPPFRACSIARHSLRHQSSSFLLFLPARTYFLRAPFFTRAFYRAKFTRQDSKSSRSFPFVTREITRFSLI